MHFFIQRLRIEKKLPMLFLFICLPFNTSFNNKTAGTATTEDCWGRKKVND